MTDVQQPQLNWEASAAATHPQVSSSLPSEVEACLKNARFVRLLASKERCWILTRCSSYISQHAMPCSLTYPL